MGLFLDGTDKNWRLRSTDTPKQGEWESLTLQGVS